jgi:hypothetical protein
MEVKERPCKTVGDRPCYDKSNSRPGYDNEEASVSLKIAYTRLNMSTVQGSHSAKIAIARLAEPRLLR